jgi:hypothetical protein
MDHSEALQVLRPQWQGGDWAKSNGELLWAHSYTVWTVGRKLACLLSLRPEEAHLLEFGCLTHDIGKRRPECKERLRAGEGPGDHKLEFVDLAAYFRDELHDRISLSDEQIRQILEITRTHHSVSGADIRAQTLARAGMLGRLLITADWIASMEQPDFETLARLQELYGGPIGPRCLSLSYFQFSRFPSPTSYLVVQIALDHYQQSGWEPLVVFPQGAIFMAPPGNQRPSRSGLAHAIEAAVIQKSLALQKPVPTGYTGDFLTLLSSQYPDQFLTGNRGIILEKLGSVDRAMVFVKLARDILSVRNRINAKVKGACVLLDLVDAANSTSSHPNVKRRYEEVYGRPAPDKVNRDMLDPLFEQARVRDVVPAGISLPIDSSALLGNLKDEQLFAILQALAEPLETGPAESRLCRYIDASLLMEEDHDFAAVALEIFDRYKTYKQTSDAEKGACERCASPVASKMQPGLNFATAPQAFSQIKPKYQYRAVCPLCGYDNLVVRKDVRADSSWVYVRIEAKMPDLLNNLQQVEDLVARVASGVRYPRQLLRLQEIPELAQLPFPRGLRIPVSEESREPSVRSSIRLNDCGFLIPLERTDTSRGPKDLRGQFAPVYHVLNFLGFRVALGTEEQNRLFGEPVVTNPKNYLRSLAVILLAHVLDKKSNKYVYSDDLIARSPSVALSYAAGDGRDRFGLKEDFLWEFLKYLIQADVPATSKRGAVGMKHLLEDAALLAPSLVDSEESKDEDALSLEDEPEEPSGPKQKRRGGIWSFCEHKPGEKLTKHSATKPISQALDELMLGRGVEFALNKFMQNLSVKIPAERAHELTAFVSGVRGIIERAEDIRKKDVTDFLRYKNGLLSAVFMFTRYPNLKSVIASQEE